MATPLLLWSPWFHAQGPPLTLQTIDNVTFIVLLSVHHGFAIYLVLLADKAALTATSLFASKGTYNK